MNPRRYPRTLNEAFPNTVEYACALDRSTRHHLSTWPRMLGGACLVLVLVHGVACSFPAK